MNWVSAIGILGAFVIGVCVGADGKFKEQERNFERERRELAERAEFWHHQAEFFREVIQNGKNTVRHQ